MNNKQTILQKIATGTGKVGIVGLGYVGLPLAVNFAEAGVNVLGFDKSAEKVNKINRGDNDIRDIRDAVLREVVDQVKLQATTNFSRMAECDALLICVPTPLDIFRKPDMSYIETACRDIGRYIKPGTFICLESTTYPTTTEDFMLPIIEESSKQNPFNLARTSDSHLPTETPNPELQTRNQEPACSVFGQARNSKPARFTFGQAKNW